MKNCVLFVGLVCCSVNALAQDTGFYVGLGAGLVDLTNSLPGEKFEGGLNEIKGGRRQISERNRNDIQDNTDVSIHALAGYSFTALLSVELGFQDLGSTDVVQDSQEFYADGSFARRTNEFELSTIAVSLDARFTHPVSKRANLFASFGAAWSEQEREYRRSRSVPLIENGSFVGFGIERYTETETNTHVDVTYGFGTEIAFDDTLDARLSVAGIELEDGRIVHYGVSLIYRL